MLRLLGSQVVLDLGLCFISRIFFLGLFQRLLPEVNKLHASIKVYFISLEGGNQQMESRLDPFYFLDQIDFWLIWVQFRVPMYSGLIKLDC